MAATDYNTIRIGITAFLSANLPWITSESQISDYSPTDPEVVFGHLPHVLVDFDARANTEWQETQEQGYMRAIPFLIEIYDEVEPSDASYGRDASISLANKLNDVEQLFEKRPYIDGLVKGSTIRSTKCETMQIDATKLGVKVRFAWMALVVFALTI